MILDLHTHVVPEHFPKSPVDRWPSMDHFEPGRAKVMIAGENFRTVTEQCWSHTRRVADLPKEGADAQAISPMPELLSYWFSPQDGLDMARYTNDTIARMVQASPQHFYGLGMVPMQDPDLAAKELGEIKKAGLAGIELGSNILGKSLGEARFLPFFQEAEKQDLAIFIHALHPTYTDRFPATERTINAIGFPIEGGLNIGSMIVSGIFEKCPTLRVLFSHGGGTFPFQLPRLQHAWSGRWNGEEADTGGVMREMIPHSPLTYARKLYYDTLLFDGRAIRYLIDYLGATQVVVGTDYPFIPREQPLTRTLRSVVNDEEWELATHANAERFLGIA